MIHEAIRELLLLQEEEMLLDASSCATVREENTLLHALMLLSTVGHAEIPVLDQEQKLKGLISMPLILDGVKQELNYDWGKLSQLKVKDVMDKDVGIVSSHLDLEDVLHQLVNHNFVSVVDITGVFKGIITRKELLTRLNFMAHDIHNHYDLIPLQEKVLKHSV